MITIPGVLRDDNPRSVPRPLLPMPVSFWHGRVNVISRNLENEKVVVGMRFAVRADQIPSDLNIPVVSMPAKSSEVSISAVIDINIPIRVRVCRGCADE